jgi:hypothetical protein
MKSGRFRNDIAQVLDQCIFQYLFFPGFVVTREVESHPKEIFGIVLHNLGFPGYSSTR